MRINGKKLLILITIFFLLCVTYMGNINYSNAYEPSGGLPNSKKFDPDYYAPSNPEEVTDGDELLKIINNILGWANLFATVAVVITSAITGIKYMVGSVEEKAEYKKSMKPYLIGCILIFGITTILRIISSIAQKLN